jgi:hypothetical protein
MWCGKETETMVPPTGLFLTEHFKIMLMILETDEEAGRTTGRLTELCMFVKLSQIALQHTVS